MSKMENIFLIGPMGAGKTTIGRLLAAELNIDFKDTDKEIEERTGADIAWIFDVEGEEGFRVRETQVLRELSAISPILLATGGGIILSEENRRLLAERGLVVYLKASLKQQIDRTGKDRKRPLLQTENPAKVLRSLMEVRGPLYQSVADIVVLTDQRNPKNMAREIAQQIQALRKSAAES